jgi:hypothetical protein
VFSYQSDILTASNFVSSYNSVTKSTLATQYNIPGADYIYYSYITPLYTTVSPCHPPCHPLSLDVMEMIHKHHHSSASVTPYSIPDITPLYTTVSPCHPPCHPLSLGVMGTITSQAITASPSIANIHSSCITPLCTTSVNSAALEG